MEETMSTGNTESSTPNRNGRDSLVDAAGSALSTAAKTAREMGDTAKNAAADTAQTVTSTVTDQVRDLLDRQVGNSARSASQFASSVKTAADDMEGQSPMIAGVVRTLADKVENYAGNLQNQTVEQMMKSASDFTRRQPGVVFGLAALAGFLMFRTVKAAPASNATAGSASPPLQPEPWANDAG